MMLSKRLILGCCALAAFGAQSPQKIFPYNYVQEDLPNGLRLITVPTDYPNIVAVYIVVQAGSRNEVEEGHTGFAHLFEHIMFKGTAKFPTEKYDQTIRAIGASSNAFTTNDYTCYHTTFSKEDLETVLMMEADRFQNLKYTEAEFRTETLAVLGEYNKNSSNPFRKLDEVVSDTAYDRSTYKHTTMGFLKDIEAMPGMFDYSLKFFDRYYRPEYVTIIVTGDVKPKAARELVDKYWGAWNRGDFKPEIPQEPPQQGARTSRVDWPAATLPLLNVAFKAPAYNDSTKDTAALDALSYLAFSPNSELYQRLIIQEQRADMLEGGAPSDYDPSLFQIIARVKKASDLDYVRDAVLATIRAFQEKPVDAAKLDTVKKHLRYRLSLSMDSSDSIASVVAAYVALSEPALRPIRAANPCRYTGRRGAIPRRTREDHRDAEGARYACRYRGRGRQPVKLFAFLLLGSALMAQTRVVQLPGDSPLVNFRFVFTAGSAADPAAKPGTAYLTAMMLAEGGTKDRTYQQILDAMFPMAASVTARVDKEMTTFSGMTHVDNLEQYYGLFRSMLLEPGWREEDFKRIKDDAINYVRVSLRQNNDEELGKEVLYQAIYRGTPYEHLSAGSVSALEKITLADVKSFYRAQYCQANLIVGLAGGFKPEFLERVKRDFKKLPQAGGFRPREKQVAVGQTSRAIIVEKDTRSVAFSFGFPIVVTRSAPDYPALLLAASYLGQHRMSGGVLYDQIRERRGLNYGDYAYIEYFPRGMFQFEPEPNLARKSQIFQIWIRPVEPGNAKFALQLALYELDKLVNEGIPPDAFERTRSFLSKYVNDLTRTKEAELGYAIDSMYYGIPNYAQYLKGALAKLTREDVNRAIKMHLNRSNRMVLAAVAKDAAGLKRELASPDPGVITYNSTKPQAILDEDKLVARRLPGLKAENIEIVPVDKMFQ